MSIAERWHACTRIPAVRTTLVVIGFTLMILAPLAGVLPGPGGIFVFAAGLALALRYSEWAKRKYVAFKRAHPKKGAWADWGMRRRSALRRQARDKARAADDRLGAAEQADNARRADAAAGLAAIERVAAVETAERLVIVETLEVVARGPRDSNADGEDGDAGESGDSRSRARSG
ncbi:PGPGW domain-containing protein [Sphingomonas parva]|uniref:PGPGW domain-containing protein n=1 Tax=Sphingomonas parva TaxID=2555898 RepID=UPI001CDC88BC|nr:PGPGW domain-containing protein [Sphingomonas parva]